jgi:hypothetical protein
VFRKITAIDPRAVLIHVEVPASSFESINVQEREPKDAPVSFLAVEAGRLGYR